MKLDEHLGCKVTEYVITICQGPPRCDLVGDAADLAIKNGCPFCQRIYGDGEGGERIVEPGNA